MNPNVWIKIHFELLKEKFGNQCFICENGYSPELQFAHRKPTNLNGNGRGRNQRFFDIRNNPDCYVLLCKSCHKDFDKLPEVIFQ